MINIATLLFLCVTTYQTPGMNKDRMPFIIRRCEIGFISKADNLNKAHIKYLKHLMHELAYKSNRFGLKNSSASTLSTMSEPDMAEMDFLENVR